MESIRGIVSFIRTVSFGSFAAAAKTMGVTPVAVSKNVQRLEDELGVRLLNRSTRKLSLTQEGRQFYESCQTPLQELEQARLALVDGRQEPSGALKVTSLTGFGRRYLLPIMPQFHTLYPKVELDLRFEDRIVDMVGEGYDVGIRGGSVPDSAMIVRPIAPLELLVCGSPEYFQTHGVPQTPDDLRNHQGINMPMPNTGRLRPWNFHRNGQHFSVMVPGYLCMNDPEAIILACMQGMGLSHMAGYLVRPLIRAGKLRAVLEDYSSRASLYIHYHNRRYLQPQVRAFIDFVLDQLKDHPCLQPTKPTTAPRQQGKVDRPRTARVATDRRKRSASR